MGLTEEFTYNDLVAVAELHRYSDKVNPPVTLVRILDFFKGEGSDLIALDPGLQLASGVPYLIFAKKSGSAYLIDPCSRTDRLDEVSEVFYRDDSLFPNMFVTLTATALARSWG